MNSKQKHIPIDRGWAWIVLVSSLLLQALSMGVALGCGVYIVEWKINFDTSVSAVSWIGSICSGTAFMAAPAASILCNIFSHRSVIMCGSALSALGIFIGGLQSNIYVLYLSFGILTGFGISLVYNPAVIVVGFHFDKYRPLAMGLSSVGSGVGPMILAPLARALIKHFGWRGAMMITSGLTLNGVALGALLRPIDSRDNGQKIQKSNTGRDVHRDVLNVELIKDIRLWAMLLNHVLWCTGSFSFFILIVDYVVSTGLSKDNGAMVVSAATFASVLARILMSGFMYIFPLVKPLHIYTISCSLMGISLMLFSTLETTVGFYLFAVLFGIWFGALLATLGIATVNLFTLEKSTSAFCYTVVGDGVGALIGPPVAGAIYGYSNNYRLPYIFGGSCAFLSGIVMAIVILAEYIQLKCNRKTDVQSADADSQFMASGELT